MATLLTRRPPLLRVAALAAGALLVVGGCTSTSDDVAEQTGSTQPGSTSTSTSSTTSPAGATSTSTSTSAPVDQAADLLGETCTWQEGELVIAYPTGWYTPASGELGACALFDPEPFVVEPQTEGPSVAVDAGHEDGDLVSAAATRFDPFFVTVLDEQRLELGGRPGGCWETATTGEGLYPAGGLARVCMVQLDGFTASFTTLSFDGEPSPDAAAAVQAMAIAVQPA